MSTYLFMNVTTKIEKCDTTFKSHIHEDYLCFPHNRTRSQASYFLLAHHGPREIEWQALSEPSPWENLRIQSFNGCNFDFN